MAPEKGNRIKVEDDGVDPHRPVPEELAKGPVPSPAEDEDPPRLRVLEGRQVGEELRLRSPGLEGEGVVLEYGDLSGERRGGDPSVGGIPCHEEPRVVPARHPPVQGGRLIEDGDQDRSQSDSDNTAGPAPFSREEEKGRGDGDQAAGDGEGEVLDAVPETERREQTSGEAPRAFDPVGAGERPAPLRMETGGLPEQQAREQAGGQQGDHQRRHLPGKGEVGAGDAAEEEAARPEEDDAERQEEGEAQKQNRRPAGGGAPAADDRPHSGQEHPDPQAR